jgi:3-mercaptopyruvate sulfurtransferase SseA
MALDPQPRRSQLGFYEIMGVFSLALLFVLMGCQVAPTKVSTSRERVSDFEQIVAKTEVPVAIGDLTVVLDVRSNFDFGLNHVVNSYNFPWSNLAERESTGELMRDTRKAVLRLSLIGVTPLTPVVIVGYGPAGQGEEGRLAWNLLYLGFKDVQTATVETFRAQMTQNPSPPAQNVKLWKTEPLENLQISKAEFLKQAHDPKGRLENKITIVDVRSEQEYLHSKHPDFQALNVEWKQFFTKNGRPNAKLKERLIAMGIKPSQRLIVISQRGVRSSAVSYALLALGYQHVQNFVGGFSSL